MKSIIRLVFVLLMGALYLALAVAGEGGVAAFFAKPALVALTVVLFGACVVAFFAGGNISPGAREDRGNRWVLAVFTVIGLLSGYVPAWTDRNNFSVLDGDSIRWFGVTLFAIGCALRLWPVFMLGRRFSGLVAIQVGHTLVTDGPYGVIRHPSYLGLLLGMFGWALAFRSGLGVLLVLLIIPPLIARINAEENLLRSQFGTQFDAYRARTSRLIPGVY